MKQLRVSLVADTFTPARDDRTLTVRQTVDHLIDNGHAVQVLTATPGVPTYRGVPVHRITGFRKRGGRIAEALDAFQPHLLHATSPDVFGRKALKQALRANLPTLVVEQAPLPNYLPASYVEQVIARADRYLVTSSWVRSQLSQRGITAHLWEPGVDLAAFDPALRDSNLHDHWARANKAGGPLLVVGYVGGLHKRNGVRRLADLADVPGVRLVIIGAGPQLGWLQDNLPFAKFLEPMSTGDLGSAMASFDVVLHPGRKQTCAHSLRAAAASGVPVVAPDRGSCTEFVTAATTGMLYNAASGDGIEQAINQLRDPHVRATLGLAARSAIAHRDWAVATGELLDVHYPAVLEARHTHTAIAS